MRRLAVELGWALLVCAAYVAAGKVALLMAIPPGYATAVWPAAGVALVAMLRLGYRVAPAIALGSFLVNAPTSAAPTGLAVAACVGVGAALQAMAGAVLVRRVAGYPSALERTGDVVRFLVVAGPVACLVGATLGAATLLAAGVVTAEAVAATWSTWWVGDTIGVVIFGPILFAFVGEPRAPWRRRRLSVVAPMVVGLAAVTAIFVLASGWEATHQTAELARRADLLSRAVERQTIRYIDAGVAAASLYKASTEVTGHELTTFAAPMIDRYRGILAFSWIARVADAERAAYERARRDQLGPGFAIMERGAGERLVVEPPRPEYFPVHEIAPASGNRDALGFDLGSEPIRADALARARDQDRPAATAPIRLVQNADRWPGILVVVAVYQPGRPTETVDQRRAALIGFVAIVIRTSDVIAVALDGLEHHGLRIRLVDTTGSGAAAVLHDDAPGATAGGQRTSFDVGGRTWRVEVTPTAAFVQAQRTWQAWLVLAGGLFLVSLLGATLLIVTGNESRLADAEARYHDLYDHSPDLYASVSADSGIVLDCNQTALEALGRGRAEVVGRPILDLYAPACHDVVRAVSDQVQATGEVHDVELQLVRADGTLLDVSLSVTAVREDGRIVLSRTAWRDIALRKQAERDEALVLLLGDQIRATQDVDELTDMVTERVGERLGVARCLFAEVDVDLEVMTVHRDFHRGVPSIVGTSSLSSYSQETQADLRAGRTVIVRDAAIDPRTASRYTEGYQPHGFRALLGVPLVRDRRWVASLWAIDDRPRDWTPREANLLQTIAERTWLWIEHARMIGQLRELNRSLEQRVGERTRELETSVREKDVLLREIHHRVKNNLQVISSLLNLQAMAFEDDALHDALGESRDRIQSLALVHDQLYRANNAATIELDRYLAELVLSIERTHARSERVRIVVDARACSLPLDQAVPCGLIVNELITNSLKHGFPGTREGTITVTAGPASGEHLRLAVADDGLGLPADFDMAQSTGLGMLIIDTLAKQLGATVTIGRDGGTRIELLFPVIATE